MTIDGAYFIETPRMYNATDGDTSARVFRTILVGKQALAEAVAEEPHVIVGPVTDKLMRARPLGYPLHCGAITAPSDGNV